MCSSGYRYNDSFTCELKPATLKPTMNDDEVVKFDCDHSPTVTFSVEVEKPLEKPAHVAPSAHVHIPKASGTNEDVSKTDEGTVPPSVSLPRHKTGRRSSTNLIVLNRKTRIQRITLTMLLCTVTIGILVPVIRFASLNLSRDVSNFASIGGIEEQIHCGPGDNRSFVVIILLCIIVSVANTIATIKVYCTILLYRNLLVGYIKWTFMLTLVLTRAIAWWLSIVTWVPCCIYYNIGTITVCEAYYAK